MKLSTRGKYGLYAMVFLAEKAQEGPQPLKSISQLGLPENYLEQLLGALRRAGLVDSVRGARGGYALAKDPRCITMRDIIDAMEGPVSFSDCLEKGHESSCPRCGKCKVRGTWEYLTDEINHLLSSVTLDDMLHGDTKGESL